MHSIGQVRRTSKGHGIGYLWFLLLEPITGGNITSHFLSWASEQAPSSLSHVCHMDVSPGPYRADMGHKTLSNQSISK